MAFVPCPGIAELAVVSIVGDVEATNVFHMDFAQVTPLTALDLENAAADISAAFVSHLEVPLSSDVGVLEVRARDLTVQFGAGIVYPVAGNGGSGAATPLPPGSAVVVTWTTGIVGRSFRGRSYLMGLPEGLVDEEGRIAGATHTALGTGATAFIGALDPGALSGAQLCVTSKFHNGAPRATGVSTPITNRQVRIHIHSQRRRNIKG